MHNCLRGAAAAAIALVLSSPAFAQIAPGAAQPRSSAASLTEARERAQLTESLVKRWKGFAEEAYQANGDHWAGELARSASLASMDALRRAAMARDFDAMNSLLLQIESKPAAAADIEAITANRIGDTAQDLVYVPVTPCRIIDTRLAGGQIAANTIRSFDVTAVSSYSFQGGDVSNCGTGASGSFAAAVINFTVVTPATAGYITAFPFGGTQPLAATLNYNAGDVKGNLAVVKLDQGASANELSVYTFAATHLIADVVGYFTNPVLDTFQCVTTAETTVSIGAGLGNNAVAPACAAGYVETATYCETSSFLAPLVFMSNGVCSANNNGVSTATLRASSRCCRSAAP